MGSCSLVSPALTWILGHYWHLKTQLGSRCLGASPFRETEARSSLSVLLTESISQGCCPSKAFCLVRWMGWGGICPCAHLPSPICQGSLPHRQLYVHVGHKHVHPLGFPLLSPPQKQLHLGHSAAMTPLAGGPALSLPPGPAAFGTPCFRSTACQVRALSPPTPEAAAFPVRHCRLQAHRNWRAF